MDSPDGTAILAIGAAALWRWTQVPGREVLVGVLVVGGAALALSGFNALDVSRQLEGSGVSLGWGLGLTVAASLGLASVAALLLYSEGPLGRGRRGGAGGLEPAGLSGLDDRLDDPRVEPGAGAAAELLDGLGVGLGG